MYESRVVMTTIGKVEELIAREQVRERGVSVSVHRALK
jgi:hypothetical protein